MTERQLRQRWARRDELYRLRRPAGLSEAEVESVRWWRGREASAFSPSAQFEAALWADPTRKVA